MTKRMPHLVMLRRCFLEEIHLQVLVTPDKAFPLLPAHPPQCVFGGHLTLARPHHFGEPVHKWQASPAPDQGHWRVGVAIH